MTDNTTAHPASTTGKWAGRRMCAFAVAAIALLVCSVVGAPAARADAWGYVNCQPNHAPYSRVLTKSYSNGSVRHTQTNGKTYSKTYNFSGWRTYV
ncbi:MAG: hypothetical protein EOO27_28620 [Comamonadaceae bacterium]|nr:MAG: hypothetical protein EOO27_28620 [Comamonadaceae bacterium]